MLMTSYIWLMEAAWYSLCIFLISSVISICSPHNKIVLSRMSLTLNVRLHISGLPLNWFTYGWLDTINTSFERGKLQNRNILHLKIKQGGRRKCLKCLGGNASIWKALIGSPLPSESQFHPFTSVSAWGMMMKKATVAEWWGPKHITTASPLSFQTVPFTSLYLHCT